MRRLLMSTLLFLSLSGSPPKALASEEVNIPKSLLQQIRELLAIVPPVAAGGSRSPEMQICLIAPLSKQQNALTKEVAYVAIVPVSNPMIITAQPLNEIRLEKDGQLLWQSVASSTTLVDAQTPWPIAPLQPNATIELVLRPRGGAGADIVRIQLLAADREVMEANEALIAALRGKPEAWQKAIKDAISQGDEDLSRTLLSSNLVPAKHKDEIEEIIGSTACRCPQFKEAMIHE